MEAAHAQLEPLYFKVLGRTMEHFGVQMYKRREVAIAELVANCWDAGSTSVLIEVPVGGSYNQLTSKITIADSGFGMSRDSVQKAYLVLGRNRRKTDGTDVDACFTSAAGGSNADSLAPEPQKTRRRVMGRKGIGKLAGFGLARKMTVTTWQLGGGIEFYLELDKLKLDDNDSTNVPITWKPIEPQTDKSPSGTIVTLELLKHKTAIDVDALRRSLARRFSRTVRGEMEIKVNGFGLPDPTPPLDKRVPNEVGEFIEEKLSCGTVKYWYGFAEAPIHDRELRGFAVMVHGKVAQAPPFFFDVEAKASGQHATRYVLGEIEADFIDDGQDDESDLVSTDRQEIDWEDDRVKAFVVWGEAMVRRILIECTDFRGEKTEKEAFGDPALRLRIERLDPTSQAQIRKFLKILGTRGIEGERGGDLADSLVRAYEFRQFHDVISEIEDAAEDPDRLARMLRELGDWRVLESRALLEIIKGRLGILDKFEKMLCNNAPETKSSVSLDNMHDLLAGNPWLLNPEWQVLSEEKSITSQLREWGRRDMKAEYDGRFDFLALSSEGMLVLIEIKRPDHASQLSEIQRLQSYSNDLSLARGTVIKRVFICGREPMMAPDLLEGIKKDPNFELREWSSLFRKTRDLYEHYRVLLEGSVAQPGFTAKKDELLRTRTFLELGVHRDTKDRAKGIPAQDIDFEGGPASA